LVLEVWGKVSWTSVKSLSMIGSRQASALKTGSKASHIQLVCRLKNYFYWLGLLVVAGMDSIVLMGQNLQVLVDCVGLQVVVSWSLHGSVSIVSMLVSG